MAGFGLAALFISPLAASVVSELAAGNFSPRLLSVLLILLGLVVSPFVVEIWGMASDSARRRLESWIMLPSAIIAMSVVYIYGAFWRPLLFPLLVPSVMGPATFGWVLGSVDGAISALALAYIVPRLIRYFQANLKAKSYRRQIPSLRALKHETLGIFLFYWVLAHLTVLGLLS